MSFPLDDAPLFGFFVVLVFEKGTDGEAVGLIDDDDEAVLEDVVGMLDLFLAGEFILGHFCWGILLDGGLGCLLRLLLRSETSQRSSLIVDSIRFGMSDTLVMYSESR